MKSNKRRVAGLGAVMVGAGLMSSAFGPAVADDSPAASTRASTDAAPRSIVAQQFTLRLAADSRQVANVRGAGTDNGVPVIQYTCGNADNELWRFVPKGIGHQIVVKSSDKCLNVAGGLGVGNSLIQYDCTAQGASNDVWLPVWEPNTL